MTIAKLRHEYNLAFRKPDTLEVFCSKLMPKVFALLEGIADDASKHEIQLLASDCCTVKAPEGKPKNPDRYTGGNTSKIP